MSTPDKFWWEERYGSNGKAFSSDLIPDPWSTNEILRASGLPPIDEEPTPRAAILRTTTHIKGPYAAGETAMEEGHRLAIERSRRTVQRLRTALVAAVIVAIGLAVYILSTR